MVGSVPFAGRDDLDEQFPHLSLLVFMKLALQSPPRDLDALLERLVAVEHERPGQDVVEHLGGRDQVARGARLRVAFPGHFLVLSRFL